MMLAAILSVTVMAIVAFGVGYVCGQSSGRRQARIEAFNRCIDWAALAMKGNLAWRFLSVDAALLKAGALIGGADVLPIASSVRSLVSVPPILSKGNQA